MGFSFKYRQSLYIIHFSHYHTVHIQSIHKYNFNTFQLDINNICEVESLLELTSANIRFLSGGDILQILAESVLSFTAATSDSS